MSATGENRWPPLGRNRWPLTAASLKPIGAARKPAAGWSRALARPSASQINGLEPTRGHPARLDRTFWSGALDPRREPFVSGRRCCLCRIVWVSRSAAAATPRPGMECSPRGDLRRPAHARREPEGLGSPGDRRGCPGRPERRLNEPPTTRRTRGESRRPSRGNCRRLPRLYRSWIQLGRSAVTLVSRRGGPVATFPPHSTEKSTASPPHRPRIGRIAPVSGAAKDQPFASDFPALCRGFSALCRDFRPFAR